jgi:2',3'-cyclic-nucleotide 2'-phosphodiesterase (5'-nucleotidase family)
MRPEYSACYISARSVLPEYYTSMRLRFVILGVALAFSLVAGAAHSAFAQTAVKPVPASKPADLKAQATETLVDSSVPADSSVEKMLEAYSPKVRALDDVIGKLKGDLRKGLVGAGSLGNFVTDGIRAEAGRKLGKPIVLAITNSGGLRKNVITEGDVRLRDIFELLPFENALVAFDLTGAQVLDLLRVVVLRGDAQSGARVKYKLNSEMKPELHTARLLIDGSEKEIDPTAIYPVISIDYLLNVTGGDHASILKQAKNIRPLGITIRDAMTQFVKSETAAGREIKAFLDGRFIFDKPDGSALEEPRQ